MFTHLFEKALWLLDSVVTYSCFAVICQRQW